MNKLLLGILTFSALYISPLVITGTANAQAEETKKSVRVPAMRNRVYTQLARAQGIADTGDRAGGLAVLDEVKSRSNSLNSYEMAMLWNFYGFMHYADENLPKAIESFKNVVSIDVIPESLRLSTLYSLAQLAMQQSDYKQTLAYLTKWQSVNTKALNADQHMLFARVYYSDKQFDKSLISTNNAIELAKVDNQAPKENWLVLQRANYYELKQPKNVTKVMEELVRLYSKPEYWIQLSGMYGEIGEEDKQLAVMEAAWQAGFINKPQDIVTLAQLYRYHGAPYKAAKVLDDAIELGKITAEERYLEMLAQSYIAAKDNDKAIPVLVKVSEISEEGKYDAQLAQAYLNTEKWQRAIKSATRAIERGGIDRVGDMYLVVGMSYFNLKKFDDSLKAFKHAKTIASSAKIAHQWAKYVASEKVHSEQIAMLN